MQSQDKGLTHQCLAERQRKSSHTFLVILLILYVPAYWGRWIPNPILGTESVPIKLAASSINASIALSKLTIKFF